MRTLGLWLLFWTSTALIILEIVFFVFIGYGLFAQKDFSQGDFLLEYVGDRITPEEAKKRDKTYARNKVNKCFIYNFQHLGKKEW